MPASKDKAKKPARKSNRPANSQAPAKRPAAKPTTVAATAAAEPKRRDKQEPVIVKHTESGPSGPSFGERFSGVKPTLSRWSGAVNRGVRNRYAWAWVGGVIAALFVGSVIWWQWEHSYVAKVGGQYITTAQLNEQNLASNGSQILTQLEQQQLILQQANKKHINVSDADVNNELKKFKDSAGGEAQYQSTLSTYGISESLLKSQIKVRLLLEQLLKDKLTVSDKEIQDYYDQNKSSVDPDNKGLNSQLKSQISDQIKQQKLSNESQNYLDTLQQQSSVQSSLDHATMTYGQFLQQNIWTIPGEIWNLFGGKK